jgi:hypothetical protein
MPIEFPCTACGQLVRTPDSAAGKKGKCPHCGTIAQIPLVSPRAAVPGLTPLPATPKPAGNTGQSQGEQAAATAVISCAGRAVDCEH